MTPRSEHYARVSAYFDEAAATDERWKRRNRGYYSIIERIFCSYIPRGARVLELGSGSGDLLAALRPSLGVGVDVSPKMVEHAAARHPGLRFFVGEAEAAPTDQKFDYVVLSDLVPYAWDIYAVCETIAGVSHARTRVLLHSYSELWRPVLWLAGLLRLKRRTPIQNWVSPQDVAAFLQLAGLEVVAVHRRVLLPKRIPFLSTFFNGYVASLPLISRLCLTYWITAKPRVRLDPLSVSVVVPCRNERGNVEEIFARVPEMGRGTELILVEGGSNDGTLEEIRRVAAASDRVTQVLVQQGQGKADAVRLGFEHATGELLMILDGDLTVPAEELTRFYDAIVSGYADLVNGSRLVYGMETGAMQALNQAGNRFFASAFSALLRQPVKDTLCGTKVLLRSDYETIAGRRHEVSEYDPFGDFDLLFGAARLGMKIGDLPVRYRARRYGSTNISRIYHGLMLMRMTLQGLQSLRVDPVRVRLRD